MKLPLNYKNEDSGFIEGRTRMFKSISSPVNLPDMYKINNPLNIQLK